jgi:hypothetical protein
MPKERKSNWLQEETVKITTVDGSKTTIQTGCCIIIFIIMLLFMIIGIVIGLSL